MREASAKWFYTSIRSEFDYEGIVRGREMCHRRTDYLSFIICEMIYCSYSKISFPYI